VSQGWFGRAFGGIALIAAAFVGLPLLALLVNEPWANALSILVSQGSLDALRLSLICSVLATAIAIALGFPLAWIQARTSLPGRSAVRALTLLPMVLPPVVGGVALLYAFGRRGLLGAPLFDAFGIRIPFSTAAVVMAEAFVAMPFFVITVEASLRTLDRRYEEAARTLGAGPWRTFRSVTLPLVAPAVFAGSVLCWARALGEFGATITFAGNLPGTTQTLPLAVYLGLAADPRSALTLSLLLVLVALVVLVALRDRWLRV
jgi:molybdate transport system permease protein